MRRPDVRELTWVRGQADPLRKLTQALQVEPFEESAALRISLSGVRPEELTRLVQAVQRAYIEEVVKAYQSCRALYSSVGEGVKQAPSQAGAIASAVISLDNCVCGAEEMWAKSRLEGRVRGPHRSPGIALSLPCTCAAAANSGSTAASLPTCATVLALSESTAPEDESPPA